MLSSEQLYITAHIKKTQGTKINLYCIKVTSLYLVTPDVATFKCLTL